MIISIRPNDNERMSQGTERGQRKEALRTKETKGNEKKNPIIKKNKENRPSNKTTSIPHQPHENNKRKITKIF